MALINVNPFRFAPDLTNLYYTADDLAGNLIDFSANGAAVADDSAVWTNCAGLVTQVAKGRYVCAFPDNVPRKRYGLTIWRKKTEDPDRGDETLFDNPAFEWSGSIEESIATVLDSLAALQGSIANSGAYTVGFTVLDGVTPLPGANVRLTLGAYTQMRVADHDGHVTFNVNGGTYQLGVTANGYDYTGPYTFEVNGSVDNANLAVTPLSITAQTDPSKITLYCTLFKTDLTPSVGETITYQMVSPPDAPDGISPDGNIGTSNPSDGAGVVQIPAWRGAVYVLTRGERTVRVEVATSGTTQAIPIFVGGSLSGS